MWASHIRDFQYGLWINLWIRGSKPVDKVVDKIVDKSGLWISGVVIHILSPGFCELSTFLSTGGMGAAGLR
jgi:hypothetical protein